MMYIQPTSCFGAPTGRVRVQSHTAFRVMALRQPGVARCCVVAVSYAAAMQILIRWLLLSAALLLLTQLYHGIQIDTFGAAMLAAFVLGLFNTFLRPVLVLLTLPVTVVTLGLFLFVINALMFYFAASVLAGFRVSGFAAALIGSLLYSACGVVIDLAMKRLFQR